MQLRCGRHRIDLDTPIVMGVLNVTPDSFSDGDRYRGLAAALDHAARMVEEGAAILDIGGESTRPGAEPVPEQQELQRVIPVIEGLAGRFDLPLSIDTMKPGVMRAAIAAGASMVNDVAALRQDGALEAVAGSDAAVCLMHMKGEPRSMQRQPEYDDVLAEVASFLAQQRARCVEAGIDPSRLVIDPGFGFGKTLEHNLELLRRLAELTAGPSPVLVGLSRKSMIGQVTGRETGDRLAGSIALAALAVRSGAKIVRAHDVGPTVDAVKIAAALAGKQVHSQ